MSWVHYVTVGHFDANGYLRTQKPIRPIDLDRVNRLLAEYPREVAACVKIQNGCVLWVWTTLSVTISQELHQFASRLAQEEGCMVVADGVTVLYPPESVQAQEEFWQQLRASSAAQQ